jgi:hypothetical protein
MASNCATMYSICSSSGCCDWIRFSKCARHDESAFCTGEVEGSEYSSQGVGEDGSSVLRLSMRELSGVYGYRNAPFAFAVP